MIPWQLWYTKNSNNNNKNNNKKYTQIKTNKINIRLKKKKKKKKKKKRKKKDSLLPFYNLTHIIGLFYSIRMVITPNQLDHEIIRQDKQQNKDIPTSDRQTDRQKDRQTNKQMDRQ